MDKNDTKKPDTSPPTEIGVCRVCNEPIKAGAAKCIHCGSYQDWTRYLLRWSALLVSILGVVPLWGIASSLHKIAFSPEIANIEAAITSCGGKEIAIAFANSGKLDGIVTDVNFFLLQDGKRSKPDVKVRPTNGLSNIVISPNKPPVLVIYKAYIGDTETKFISESQSSKSCSFVFEINWVDFKGSKKQISRECLCPQ